MNKLTSLLIAFAILASFSQCKSGKLSQSSTNSAKGLKDYYKDYFLMGVAITPRNLQGADSALIVNHFNSVTAENAMKMGPIHPKENEYFWKDADAIADFAKKQGLKMRGHTLCWHSQAPAWMFKDEKGDTVSKAVLLQRLKDHIRSEERRVGKECSTWWA